MRVLLQHAKNKRAPLQHAFLSERVKRLTLSSIKTKRKKRKIKLFVALLFQRLALAPEHNENTQISLYLIRSDAHKMLGCFDCE